jgi:pilus assembly protein FimV
MRSVLWLAVAASIALAAPVAAQQGADSTYGPVRRADTLWDLALRFRGDSGVNAQQAMIAILRANPDAFVDGNINALRTGVTLRVPTAAKMAAVTRGDAAAEFARHEQAWRNRRRTGSAAPGPSSPASPGPASAPAGGAPAPEDDDAEELRKARATVSELRERLSERDDAIEDLLVQLAAVRRELRSLQETAAPTPPGDAEGRGEETPGRDEAPGASWLPVSPLILGSSLIVLLVLIVVVTLLRQRGETEEALAEDREDEEGEASYGDEDGGEPWEREDEGAGPYADGEEALPVERGVSPAGAVRAATVAPAAAAVPARGFTGDDETGDHREDEAADLPIGMDLDDEERWEPEPEGADPDRPEPQDPEGRPDGAPEFSRHVEVGELDELELDVGPAPGVFPDIPADLGEEDDPPEGAGPGRPGRGRRE